MNMADYALITGASSGIGLELATQHGYQAMKHGDALSIHGLFNRLRVFSLRTAPRAMVTAMTAGILKRGE